MALVLLSLALLLAAVGKWLRLNDFRLHLAARLDSPRTASWLSKATVGVELAAAISLWTPLGKVVAACLFAAFPIAAIWLISGQASLKEVDLPSCNCYGAMSLVEEAEWIDLAVFRPAWWALRNGTLTGLSLVLVGVRWPISQAVLWAVLAVTTAMAGRMAGSVMKLRRDLSVAIS